jgi:hypothetical protein
MLALLRRIAIEISPLRESREFRLLVGGQIVSNLGTQAALVALPCQIYLISRWRRSLDCWERSSSAR